MYRYLPYFKKVKEIIEENSLGKIVNINSTFSTKVYKQKKVIGSKKSEIKNDQEKSKSISKNTSPNSKKEMKKSHNIKKETTKTTKVTNTPKKSK